MPSARSTIHSRLFDLPGEAGRIIADFDWSQTSLGPIGGWQQSLRTTIGLIIRSPVPMTLLMGSDGVMLYNDAFAAFAGARHPQALGSKVRESWPEVADFNANVISIGLAGESVFYTNQRMTLHRNGRAEQVWMTLGYSPVLDDADQPIGVLAVVTETTGMVLQEKASIKERERFRQMFDQATGFMALLRGPDHVFDLVNAGYLQLIGHRNVTGKAVRDALPEVIGQGYLELLDEVFSSGKPFSGTEMTVTLQRSPDAPGEQRFIDLEFQPVREDGGGIVGIFVKGTDVTDRIAARHAAEASAEQFQSFAQTLPNHVWMSQPDGLLDWFNEPVYTYSGHKPGQLDGTGWAMMVHPEDREQAGARWQEALAAGTIYEMEFRLRRHDGAYRWHLARALPIREPSGSITRWVGTNTDIHHRKEAEAETAADLERIWSSTEDLMATASTSGYLKSVNPAWARVLGYDDADLLGSHFAKFVDPEDQPKLAKLLAGMAAVGPIPKAELRLMGKNGKRTVIAWSADTVGPTSYLVGRDVTQQRVGEAALRQSQKMEAVGQLTGGIAHDFNNILAAIGGSIEVVRRLRKSGRAEEVDRFLAAAEAATQRASGLTHRLLAFSRLQSLDARAEDVNLVVEGMEDLLRRTLGERIDLKMECRPAVWPAYTDANQLESAILNLAINARDAMPEGGRLTIETSNARLDETYANDHAEVSPGEYVAVSVSDTGTGMTPEVVAKAFDPFFTTKPVGQGTGLGLSMIYGFAKQSSGHIRIYSEVGRGTTIKLFLPRAQSESAEPESTAILNVPKGHGETVMVVEDEPTVRLLIVEVLKELGYKYLEYADPAAAIPILNSPATVDLLVTDVGLPYMNGRQLAELARARRPTLKVLFITGYAQTAAVRGDFLERDMEMLTKPFTLDSLAAKIRAMLSTS